MGKITICKEQLILSDNPNIIIGTLLKNAGYSYQYKLHKSFNPRNLTIEYCWDKRKVLE